MLKKHIIHCLYIFLFFIAVSAEAQETKMPIIPQNAVGWPTPIGFIPKGWDMLYMSVVYPEKRDKYDWAMAIQPIDSVHAIQFPISPYKKWDLDIPYTGYSVLPSQPKILLIASWDAVARDDKLVVQYNNFLYQNRDTSICEPFNYLFVDSFNVLNIGFEYMKKDKSFQTSNRYVFSFFLLGNDFYLGELKKSTFNCSKQETFVTTLYQNKELMKRSDTQKEIIKGIKLNDIDVPNFKIKGKKVILPPSF